MFPKFLSKSVPLATDFDSFKRQESTFIILNLFILATLLLVHALLASHWGFPSLSLIAILAVAILAQGIELFWLVARAKPPGQRGMLLLSWALICFNIPLAILLQEVTNRPDTQYFILLIVPVLVASFRLALLPTLGVVAVVDCINFVWVWHYGHHLNRTPISEYIEAGTISLIYTVVGILVWLLVNHLRQKEVWLSQSLSNLKTAEGRLVQEERLAAVGRLASAIAHEIRNPVSAIVSALSTARGGALAAPEREELFDIATKESRRLERLTNDFLAYARPRSPQRRPSPVDDTLGYVADSCRPRAHEKRVFIDAHTTSGFVAEIDPDHVQQALMNLVLNAVEAAPRGGTVKLRARPNSDGSVQIEVENDGPGIPSASVTRIFEPFFTTKPQGTGLGLAIARNIAGAHGGELVLSANEPGRVCFTLTIPAVKRIQDLSDPYGGSRREEQRA